MLLLLPLLPLLLLMLLLVLVVGSCSRFWNLTILHQTISEERQCSPQTPTTEVGKVTFPNPDNPGFGHETRPRKLFVVAWAAILGDWQHPVSEAICPRPMLWSIDRLKGLKAPTP